MRALAAAGILALLSSMAVAGEGIKIKTGDTSVQVGPGGVKVRTPGANVHTGAGGTSVQTGGDAGGSAGGKSVAFAGTDKSITHTCDDTHARAVSIDGVDNTVTLKGKCDSVTVTGTSNKVSMETVSRIVVSGVDNVLTYQSGPDGKAPAISRTGVDNSVTKRKD